MRRTARWRRAPPPTRPRARDRAAGAKRWRGGVNHSATPKMPPTATLAKGMATPWIPASTMSPPSDRSSATSPVANCGASSVRVAAAVKAVAPSAPIRNPSSDSRVDLSRTRTTSAGTSISSASPIGMASAYRSVCPTPVCVTSGTPYPSANTVPAIHAQPTPSTTPMTAARTSVAKRDIAANADLAQVDDEQHRKSERGGRDHRRLPPQHGESGQRHEQDDQSDPERCARPTRQMRKQRTHQCGPKNTLPRRRGIRAKPQPIPPVAGGCADRPAPQDPQNAPAGASAPHAGQWTVDTVYPSAKESVPVMAEHPRTDDRGDCAQGSRHWGCRARSPGHTRERRRRRRCRQGVTSRNPGSFEPAAIR